jgi:alpha-beta hydrolase superfamily lysophospholipase
MPPRRNLDRARRAGVAAALAALPVALAYRFALVYRVRAGYPHRHPPVWTPDIVGLAYEEVEIPSSDGLRLPGWYMPAGPAARPGVVLVHGWESARDRTIPHAQVLHAAGFHVLTFDVRGNGANGPEALPMSVGEYAADARAGVAELRRRPEVTRIGLLGHSMGAAGSLVAAAEDADVDAVIAVAAPADPYRLTRQTFRLARLPIPAPIAWPLAWLTTRVYLQPRGHTVESVSATAAVRSIERPVMLVHGSEDGVVPVSDLARLAEARRTARPDAVTETLLVEGGRHSWLYEFPAYRAAIARFLTESLGGPFAPDEAAAVAAAVPAVRLPDPERLTTLDEEPGGFRSLTRVLRRRESAGGGNGQVAGDANEPSPQSGGSPSSSMIATAAVSSSISSPSSAASAESGGAVETRSGAGAPSAR